MLAAAWAAVAPAHVVYQRKTLREWAQQADVMIVAQILSPLRVWTAPDGSDHQEYFSLRVVEVVAGELTATTLDVFPHAEGEPRYRVGERALLFLDRTASHGELARLAQRFPYFTTQGAGHEWQLDDSAAEVVALARAWRALGPGAAYPARRDLLLRELEAANRQLRAEAIADLAAIRDALITDPPAVDRLVAMIRADALQVREKIGLIRMLEGAPGFAPAAELQRLAAAAQAAGDDDGRAAVLRAAGALRDQAMTAWLRAQLAASDREIVVAALAGLGHPWHGAAVPDVAAAAAAGGDPRIVAAAIRTLGGIADDDSAAALRAIAAAPQQPAASLAAAQLRRLERRRP